MASVEKRYTLEYENHHLEVESIEVGFGYLARLFVDGELKAEQKARNERAQLQAGNVTVLVRWGNFGQVKRCVLVQQLHNGEEGQVQEVPFAPPPGTHAARLAKLERERPVLYASRHVLRAVLQLLLPLLGIGALLAAFLPRVDLTWLPAPLYDKLFGPPPTWLAPVLDSPIFRVAKWALPVIIAVLIAINEIEKHQKKSANVPAGETHPGSGSTEESRGTHR